MASRIPDIELLMAFRQVARDRNFTRAAEAMNVTQSAISHRVRRLERQIDKVLFQRNPHAVQLTKDGEALLQQIAPALEQLDSTFAAKPEVPGKTLQIELESAFASNWLTPRLRAFTALYPDVHIQLSFSARAPEFAGDTQLAIKWGNGDWPGYEVSFLMASQVAPMCAPGLLNAPDDLAHRTLLHDRDTETWTSWAESTETTGLNTRAGHVFQDTLALQQAAIDGHGVALYPVELADRALASRDLVMPFPELTIAGPGNYHVLQRSGSLTPLASAFLNWLRDTVAQ